jgi:hypothetical protein
MHYRLLQRLESLHSARNGDAAVSVSENQICNELRLANGYNDALRTFAAESQISAQEAEPYVKERRSKSGHDVRTQNHQISGISPSSKILNTRIDKVSETGSVLSSGERRDTPTLLGRVDQ